MDQIPPSGEAAESPSSRPQDQDEALRQSEEDFRLLVDQVTEYAIFRLDPGGHVVSWNAGAERIKGYAEEEILGTHFSAFYTEEAVEEGVPDDALEHAAREGEWKSEGWRVRKDGSRFWASVTLTALRGEDGKLRGFAKVTRDLTERHRREEKLRQREQALRESERRYRRLFEEAQEGIAISTPDGEIVDANAVAGDILGYPREELLEMNAAELYADPKQRQKGRELMAEEGVLRNFEVRVRRKDGTEIICQLTSTALRGPGGETEAFQTFVRDITERRQAEEALRESERRYRRLFEESQEGITITAPNGTIVDANPAVCRINGYSREELIGMSASALYTSDEERDELVRTLREKGQIRNAEMRFRRKDGEEFICQISATVWEDEEGEIEAIQSFARDITEKKQAEEALKESEAMFRALSDNASVGIAMLQDGVYVHVNPAAARIYGYSREELIGRSPEMVVHSDDWPEVRDQIQRRLEGEVRQAPLEVRIVTKSGAVRIVEVTSSRITYRGRPAVIGTILDVTERKRAEEALRESEQKFRRLFEESRDAVVLTTPEGTIVDANGAAEELFGYSREELLRLDASELYADLAERERRILPALKEATSSRVLEAEMRHKDGHTFLASASVTVHRGEEGHPELIQALVRDITDQRRLQREVLRVQEEERRRFGQDLHDGVASQLTGVAILLGSLAKRSAAEDDSLAEAIREARDIVDESCQDVRRLSRGLAPAGLADGGLPSALGRLAENVEGGVFEKAGDLPGFDDDAAAHLYWIAQEAVTNARKYAEAGEIAMRLVREDDAFALEIEDDGRGFDLEGVEEEGLGLRTMRYRAELLGGALTIDSSPGRGTCVTCRLPL